MKMKMNPSLPRPTPPRSLALPLPLPLTTTLLYLLILILTLSTHLEQVTAKKPKMQCRDPDLGSQSVHRLSDRKFLVVGGVGAGIGNFLIFYPAAYYFAAMTGRDILIKDESLIGELCKVLVCGYPFFSQMSAAFPALVDASLVDERKMRGMKVMDFHRHFSGEAVVDDRLIIAHGYKYQSGWYLNYNHSNECIRQLTGCKDHDVSCHDRHALQRLVRGPFKSPFPTAEEASIIGVPENLKHAIMALPHAFAPRLDAAVHLRSQFKHFEQLIGPDDPGWQEALRQEAQWLGSTDKDKGMGLYRVIEQKIMAELPAIKMQRQIVARRRATFARLLAAHRGRRSLQAEAADGLRNVSELDYQFEHETFRGDGDDKVYVYIASDNERVKSGFAYYLIGHAHIAVMRVKNPGIIVHAKNLGYLKDQKNNTGVLNLVLDWYAMSLANRVFAWRRDTGLISTYSQSACRMSGSMDAIDTIVKTDDEDSNGGNSNGGSSNAKDSATTTSNPNGKDPEAQGKGFLLTFKNHREHWNEFN